MPYLLLAIAIGSEIVATTFLKYSEGFSRLIPHDLRCILSDLSCDIWKNGYETESWNGICNLVRCGYCSNHTDFSSCFQRKSQHFRDFWNCMHYDWVRDFKYEWNRSMTGSFLLKGMSRLKSSISIKISQNLTK